MRRTKSRSQRTKKPTGPCPVCDFRARAQGKARQVKLSFTPQFYINRAHKYNGAALFLGGCWIPFDWEFPPAVGCRLGWVYGCRPWTGPPLLGAIQLRGFPRFVEKSKNPPFQPKVEIPFPVVAGEVEYITIEAKHRGRGRCFHRAMNFLDCLGKRIFYGGHS